MKELINSLNIPKHVLDKTEVFMKTIFGPSAKEIGELFADKVRFRRLKNQVDIFRQTVELLDKNGLSAKELPLKALVPLIEKSSLEEDPLLQTKWSNLIANIVSSPETGLEPKLIKTLDSLSSLEAQVLDFSFQTFLEERSARFERDQASKWKSYKSVNDVKLEYVIIKFDKVQMEFGLNHNFAKICIDNIEALGLIRYEEPSVEIENQTPNANIQDDEDNGQYVDLDLDVSAYLNQTDDFYLTAYGKYFIEQCKEVSVNSNK